MFKILLYYPASDTFVISESYDESYAFSSYFSVNMDGININSIDKTSETKLTTAKNYDYWREILFLLVRIIITILLEIGIALLFGFRKKNVLITIVVVNVITQLALNVGLNVISYFRGSLTAMIYFILLEAAIFVVEAIVYAVVFRKTDALKYPPWKSAIYALVANAVSAGMGFVLAFVINAMAI